MHQKYQFETTEPINNLCPKIEDTKQDHRTEVFIKKVVTVESLKATLGLHHDIGTLIQSRQEFTLTGRIVYFTPSEFQQLMLIDNFT